MAACNECRFDRLRLINNCFVREADFPKLLCYIGFGKSYLIPFPPNFEIGEGIELCHIIFTPPPIINNILQVHAN